MAAEVVTGAAVPGGDGCRDAVGGDVGSWCSW